MNSSCPDFVGLMGAEELTNPCDDIYFSSKLLASKSTLSLFYKEKYLLSSKMPVYELHARSIVVRDAEDIFVYQKNHTCFEIVCFKCLVCYRVLIQGSVGVLQERPLMQNQGQNDKPLLQFFPLQLRPFIELNSSRLCAHSLPSEDEDFVNSSFESEDSNYDPFENRSSIYQFTNDTMVGSFRSMPLLCWNDSIEI